MEKSSLSFVGDEHCGKVETTGSRLAEAKTLDAEESTFFSEIIFFSTCFSAFGICMGGVVKGGSIGTAASTESFLKEFCIMKGIVGLARSFIPHMHIPRTAHVPRIHFTGSEVVDFAEYVEGISPWAVSNMMSLGTRDACILLALYKDSSKKKMERSK
eukprot:752780-Hanusia_phi.AAC.4